MKKRIALLLSLLLFACTLPAFAQEHLGEWELPWWCMLECEDTVLTLTLPMDDAQECRWHVTNSNESVLELITLEVLGDEPNESDEPLWIASFASIGRKSGSVVLQLTQTRGETVIQTNLLNMYIQADGTILITQALETAFPYELDMYYLQVGAYSKRENAEKQLQALTQRGFDGLIKYSDGLYKVQAGAFALKPNAQNQLAALKDAGFQDAYISTKLIGKIVAGADTFQPPFFPYTVQKNDTLWGLARKFLGDGTQWKQIAELNQIGMEIYTGEVLLIPY